MDLATVDGAAQHEMVAAPAVVGAAPVGRDGPAELAQGDHSHIVPPGQRSTGYPCQGLSEAGKGIVAADAPVLRFHLIDERAQCLVDLVEALGQVVARVRLHIEAAEADKVGAALGAQLRARLDQLGHLVELSAYFGFGEFCLFELEVKDRAQFLGAVERRRSERRNGLPEGAGNVHTLAQPGTALAPGRLEANRALRGIEYVLCHTLGLDDFRVPIDREGARTELAMHRIEHPAKHTLGRRVLQLVSTSVLRRSIRNSLVEHTPCICRALACAWRLCAAMVATSCAKIFGGS
eukprot:scaffold101256_cov72-Phaeocystis_antarctica.AAC.7